MAEGYYIFVIHKRSLVVGIYHTCPRT